MNQIQTILVGVDFSEGARAALHQALRLAAPTHAALHLLHVIDTQALAALTGGPRHFGTPGLRP